MIFEEKDKTTEEENIYNLIETGKLPISRNNIEVLCRSEDSDFRSTINRKSHEADLVITGFRNELVKRQGVDAFAGFGEVGNVLFLNAAEEVKIK